MSNIKLACLLSMLVFFIGLIIILAVLLSALPKEYMVIIIQPLPEVEESQPIAPEVVEEPVTEPPPPEVVEEPVTEPPPPEVVAAEEPEGPLYDVPLSEELQRYTYKLCQEYHVDYELVLAVMSLESNFDPDIISDTNDYGLMQINRCNHTWLKNTLGITNILDPQDNIHAGVYMLSLYVNKYETVNEALMAYNMGEHGAARHWNAGTYTSPYVVRVLEKLKSII